MQTLILDVVASSPSPIAFEQVSNQKSIPMPGVSYMICIVLHTLLAEAYSKAPNMTNIV